MRGKRHKPPCREAGRAVGIVGTRGDARDLAELHGGDALVPRGDDTAEPELERERLLARVLRAPERHAQVVVLAVTRAVHRHRLAALRHRPAALAKHCLLVAHLSRVCGSTEKKNQMGKKINQSHKKTQRECDEL